MKRLKKLEHLKSLDLIDEETADEIERDIRQLQEENTKKRNYLKKLISNSDIPYVIIE
jgi:hypothetical protein